MKMDIRIEADLTKWVGDNLERGARAVTNAVRQTTRQIEKDLEAATAGAGLGRLSKAWNSRVFPSGPSLGASGQIYAKGEDRTVGALTAYSTGVRIQPKGGKYLWVPTPAVIKRYGAKIGVGDFEEAGIKLRFVPPSGGRKWPLLVADDFVAGRKAGTYRVATASRLKSGRGLATVVMFIGVRAVDVAKRFDIEATVETSLRGLPGKIAAAWEPGA